MKAIPLYAAGLCTAFLATSALAQTPVDFSVDGPGENMVEYQITASGSLQSINIDLDYTNGEDWTWAGDILIGIIDPNGNAIEYGGYNVSLGYEVAGDFPAEWDVSDNGNYVITGIDVSAFGLEGKGVWTFQFVDGYTGSTETNNWTGQLMAVGLGGGGDPTGACCVPGDKGCSIYTEKECSAMAGNYQGDWSDCEDWPCGGEPTGACCFDGGDCAGDLTTGACGALGGDYQGDGSTCDTDTCQAPGGGNSVDFSIDGPGENMVEYKFSSSGSLSHLDIDLMYTNGGDFTWAGDLLIGIIDPNGNAIEYGGYNVSLGYEVAGDFPEEWDVSDNGNYVITGIDVSAFGLNGTGTWTIQFVDGYTTSTEGNNWTGVLLAGGLGDGGPPTGACCVPDDKGCSIYTYKECYGMGGDYQGDGSDCEDWPCGGEPTGACCLNDVDCAGDMTSGACGALGGDYLGDGSTCGADTCQAPGGGNSVDFSVDGPGENMVEYTISSSGSLTHLDIDLMYTNGEDWTWAGDILIGILDPNGNAIEYGGYNVSLGYEVAGDFPEEWDVSDNGNYVITGIDVSAFGLHGSGTWTIQFVDGYTGSTEGNNWTGELIAGGLSDGGDPTGACCVEGMCSDYTEQECAAMGGSYEGDGSDCGTVVCETCPGDANGDGQADVSDILVVIGAWGDMGGPGDVNDDGSVDVTDLLQVIAWYNGC